MLLQQKNNLSKQKKDNKRWLKFAAIFLAVMVIIAGLVAGLIFGIRAVYADKFYPGVKISGVDIGGLTKEEMSKRFNGMEDNLQQTGLAFIAENKNITVKSIVTSDLDPDLAKTILDFDWQQTADKAFAIGHSGNILADLWDQLQAVIAGRNVAVVYYLDEAGLINILETNFSGLEKPPMDAKLAIVGDQLQIIPEQAGYIFDYNKAVGQLKANLAKLNFDKVNLNLVPTEAKIKSADTAAAKSSLERILAIDSLKLTASSTSWTLTKTQFEPWLEFQENNGLVVIGLNKEKVLDFLKPMAAEIDQPGKDAKLIMVNNKVTEFQASQDGLVLDLEAAYQKINAAISGGLSDPIALPIAVKHPDVSIGDINGLGITELIGEGKSNFAGSPKNRRANIAVGAKSLNGILIKPGEEFSVIKALGEIDGAHGYLQELVIKGNRTIPEYGGGLCQIGTTAFRVALNSGLPITSRRSHTYRVVYYEPAGMDATIYDPQPDLRFINDTGNYILFATKIQGDNLIFDFYGTKDGRTVVLDPNPPRIFNVTASGPVRNIETIDLKPGEKKKVESAHKGADTFFKYIVTYPDGTVKVKDFASHYVPWPETWLVGAAASSTPATGDIVSPDAAVAPVTP